jgi:CheY-like chemotaxis protein
MFLYALYMQKSHSHTCSSARQMPVMDGLEACRAIMESTQIVLKPRIVFATAHVSESFETDCAAAGGSSFHGFLPKPFTVQDIERSLDTIVSSAWSDGGFHEFNDSASSIGNTTVSSGCM